jgi:hypothetical protein
VEVIAMTQMEKDKSLEQLKAEAEQLKAEVLKGKPEDKVERIALAITPLIKAAILTIVVLFLFRLL